MLTAYIRAAMNRATYELLGNGEGYYGEIPGLQGVWANEDTLEACRNELQSALEDWILLRLRQGLTVPALDGIDLTAPMVSQEAA
jgi:predicted RNase H-like HicB family nuclease